MNNLTFSKIVKLLLIILIFIFLLSKKKSNPLLCLDKNKVIFVIKSPGLGDLQILLSNIHHISKKNGRPLTVLAQKTNRCKICI